LMRQPVARRMPVARASVQILPSLESGARERADASARQARSPSKHEARRYTDTRPQIYGVAICCS
jgi:hypothetical protein